MSYFASEPRQRSRHDAVILAGLEKAIVWPHRKPMLPALTSLQSFVAAAVAMADDADASTLVVVDLDERGRVQSLDAMTEHGVQRTRPELQGRTLWPRNEHAFPASTGGGWVLSARSGGTCYHARPPRSQQQTCAPFVHSTIDGAEHRAMSTGTQALLRASMRVITCLTARLFPEGVLSEFMQFPREEAVAMRFVRGEAISDVAEQLGISVNTVGCHLKRTPKKCRVARRCTLVARHLGLSPSGYPSLTQPKPSSESTVDEGGCP